MANAVAWCSLVMATISILLAVRSVRASSRADSIATRLAKEPPPSAATLAALSAEVVDLSSTVEKLTTNTLKVNSRLAMRELRAKRSESSPPPLGAGKAELRRFYGLQSTGRDFVNRQRELELAKTQEADHA